MRHIPHAEGFPGLDKESRPRAARHRRAPRSRLRLAGDDAAQADLAGLPELIGKGQKIYATSARETEANWKIVLEGFLEGYHIRATHPESFFPYGFDNLNVIEHSVRTVA